MKKKKLNELMMLGSDTGVSYKEMTAILEKIEREIKNCVKSLARNTFTPANGAKTWREHLKPALEAYDFIHAAAASQEEVINHKILRDKRGEKSESGSEDNKSEEHNK